MENSYHVVVESGRVGVNKRDEFFHRPVQWFQQLPHLSVEMVELLVAVGQETDHCAKRRALGTGLTRWLLLRHSKWVAR